MQWLIARYQPTSLFSLKHGDATSTGGKSLLIPTPFAIRMALLDVAIRTEGVQAGPTAFECIKSLRLAIRLPDHAAVASIFVKVLKPDRKAASTGRAMLQTIAFREYVHLTGELGLAFGGETESLNAIVHLLPHINYFGKRGSFFQLLGQPSQEATEGDLPPDKFERLEGLVLSDDSGAGSFPLGLIQRLDEWGDGMTFEKANIYERDRKHRIRLGKERIRMDTILSYQLKRSSRGYTLYERLD